MDKNWIHTMEVFDDYERRFAQARAAKTLTRPWEPDVRAQLLEQTKQMLGYREDLIPAIGDMEETFREEFEGYSVIQYRYRTWANFYIAATLYLPHSQKPLPLVFVCCGHGEVGRLTGSYVAMGHRLATLGMAALVLDNIGQGDRNLDSPEFKGPNHWMSVAPFYCGLTLQGLIVMETIAIIRHMKADTRFDASRFAACGNSGGGTLTLFLSALAPELSAVASSGYPSEFAYVMQKERRHCGCNMLRGCCVGPDMWEIYSLCAPRPLLLEAGNLDNLLPVDLVQRNARKVQNTYIQMGAEAQFEFALTNTTHSWDVPDVDRISRFMSERLLGKTPEALEALNRNISDHWHVSMPADMLTTDALVQALTGITVPEGIDLYDVFVPTCAGTPVNPEEIQRDVGRGDVMRVFAQMECALTK